MSWSVDPTSTFRSPPRATRTPAFQLSGPGARPKLCWPTSQRIHRRGRRPWLSRRHSKTAQTCSPTIRPASGCCQWHLGASMCPPPRRSGPAVPSSFRPGCLPVRLRSRYPSGPHPKPEWRKRQKLPKRDRQTLFQSITPHRRRRIRLVQPGADPASRVEQMREGKR